MNQSPEYLQEALTKALVRNVQLSEDNVRLRDERDEALEKLRRAESELLTLANGDLLPDWASNNAKIAQSELGNLKALQAETPACRTNRRGDHISSPIQMK